MNENIWRKKWADDQIKAILLEQFDIFWQRDIGIERTQLANVKKAAHLPHAVIISGLRRVGKSTLLAQFAHGLGQERFYYLNFEDERFLEFQVDDVNYLFELLVELFGRRQIFIIDEIQNIVGWEHFVRRFMDMGHKFYITGSNAALLSRELGTRLTGRYITIELFPFSFHEFLRFHHEPIPNLQRLKTVDRADLKRQLGKYLQTGGIPDALKYPDFPLLRTLYDDVLYRDIATRYRLEAVATLKELAFYLMSNPSGLVSFNKLKGRFRVGSTNTIKNYIDYMVNSWLIFKLSIYDFSVKRQQIAPKKIYAIDTGLAQAVGFAFSPNTGKLLENMIFLALRRQTQEIYYVTTPRGYEVDFYLPERGELIQVAQHLDKPQTRLREVRALADTVPHLQVNRAVILSNKNEAAISQEGLTITVRSTAEWLLERSLNEEN